MKELNSLSWNYLFSPHHLTHTNTNPIVMNHQ